MNKALAHIARMESEFLFASLIWGSIGAGCFIYGKRQGRMAAMFGGLALIGASYFLSDAMVMSIASAGIMIAIWFLAKREE